jgi:hypothetical protein
LLAYWGGRLVIAAYTSDSLTLLYSKPFQIDRATDARIVRFGIVPSWCFDTAPEWSQGFWSLWQVARRG